MKTTLMLLLGSAASAPGQSSAGAYRYGRDDDSTVLAHGYAFE